ncbi:MAG: ABC transporter permease [Elusimicrobia bacterium]|nr:ABC transporter permease [Elusimicrobiota bacterium]
MSAPGFRRQFDILVDRNLAVHWGAKGAALAMLAQAPVIGYFIGVAWRGQEPAPATYLVFAVASRWMGCMNACTSIVQERAIYRRERMFGLDAGAYLLSKVVVLAAVAAAQTLLLLLTQGRLMHLGESLGQEFARFAILWTANLAAAGLGLAVSSFARTPYGAVVSVPILLIPQVLFSRILLHENVDSGLPAFIEKLTITKWTYDSLSNLREGATAFTQFKCFSALAACLAAYLGLSLLRLRNTE